MSSYSWSEAVTTGTNFNAVAMSGSGQHMFACNYVTVFYADTGLFMSSDYGAHWNLTSLEFGYQESCVAIAASDSADFIYVSKGYDNYALYKSVDFGTTWEVTDSIIDVNLVNMAVNSTGQQIAACAYPVSGVPGGIYLNKNWGDGEWTQIGGEDGPPCTSIASSASGQYLAALTNYIGENLPSPDRQGFVYVSSDYGSTWTAALAGDANYWCAVTMDAAGKNMLVSTNAFEYYTSSNYGVTWIFHDIQYTTEYTSVALSAQGSVAASSARNGLYVSNNAGASWALSYPPKSANIYLSCSDNGYVMVASSSDGSKLLASLCAVLYIGTVVGGGGGGGSSDGLSAGATAGVVIGVLAGVSLIAVAAWFLVVPMLTKAPLAAADAAAAATAVEVPPVV